jgi:hypothetical protein
MWIRGRVREALSYISVNADSHCIVADPLLGLRKTRHGRIAICDECSILIRKA